MTKSAEIERKARVARYWGSLTDENDSNPYVVDRLGGGYGHCRRISTEPCRSTPRPHEGNICQNRSWTRASHHHDGRWRDPDLRISRGLRQFSWNGLSGTRSALALVIRDGPVQFVATG